MTQTRQGLRSTKPKPKTYAQALQDSPVPVSPSLPASLCPAVQPRELSNELHVRVVSVSKLYTDDTGRFPIRSRKGNQYIMIAYHCDSNTILQAPFKTKKDAHRIEAYNSIMQRLRDRGHRVDLQILDNEASADYKRVIEQKWKCNYQLVPPDVHRRNAAERAIRTFKAHFLSILSGVDANFPKFLWDLLLPQTELTLNLLRQATLDPTKSAWEYFNGPFNYDATPIGPAGCKILIHNKPGTRKSWDFRGRDGFNIGVALKHYRCFHVVDRETKALLFSDTVEFRHSYLTQPTLTHSDRITHALHLLTCALQDLPDLTHDAQLHAISSLRTLFSQWRQAPTPVLAPPEPQPLDDDNPPPRVFPQDPPHTPPSPAPRVSLPESPRSPPPPSPRVSPPRTPAKLPQPSPRVVTPLITYHHVSPKGNPTPQAPVSSRTRSKSFPVQVPPDPVSNRTRSRTHQANTVKPLATSGRRFPLAFLAHWACPVVDLDTGQTLEYRQLRAHPKYQAVWNQSYANELGRLCQGIGTGPAANSQRVTGTNSFYPIHYEDIPRDRRKEITYTKVVCMHRPQKEDSDRTRITIGGNLICYPGDVSTPTGSLELAKLVFNSVLSRRGAKFACFDIKNFYLCTPLDRFEYVRIKLADIPDEFINEYDLTSKVRDGWAYFEIRRGVYGLPQSGKLANDLLKKRLETAGYYEAATTPGLWLHKWRPILFTLIVDDFGIEYVGERHANHLRDVLKKHYEITEDWKGEKFAGIDLEWDYAKRTCRLSMKGYIRKLLAQYGHPVPLKRQLSPHKHTPIVYGAKIQTAPEPDTSPPLDDAGVRRVQAIVGSVLWYARAVDNKLLVSLSAIGSQQASATEATNEAVTQLLDYLATYPDDGILYRASAMTLSAHADAGFLNESRARSRAGAHIFLSENEPIPIRNGAVITIAEIIKFVMSSAAEAEIAALFIAAKRMVPLRHTLIEMKWPQPPSPIQTDNTTAVGVTNNTIVPKQTKSMDMRFHWLRCREAQKQFRVYWNHGKFNDGDYSTKHHPPIYHEEHRHSHAG